MASKFDLLKPKHIGAPEHSNITLGIQFFQKRPKLESIVKKAYVDTNLELSSKALEVVKSK